MKNIRVFFFLLFFPVALPGQWSQSGRISYGGIDRILYFDGALFFLHKGVVEQSIDFGASWRQVFDVHQIDNETARSSVKSRLEKTPEGLLLTFEIPYSGRAYFLSQDGAEWKRMPNEFLPIREIQPADILCTFYLPTLDSVAGTILHYLKARDSIFAIALVKRGERELSYEVISRERNGKEEDAFSGIWSCPLPDSLCGLFSTILPPAISLPGDNIPMVMYDSSADFLVVYGNERTILIDSPSGWRLIPDLNIPVELHPPLLVNGMLLAVAEDGGIWRLDLG